MELTSPLFADGGRLLRPHERISPPLTWTAPPPGTASLALTAERDRSRSWEEVLATEPETYWLVWGLPPHAGRLDAGASPVRQGRNASGEVDYRVSPDGAFDHPIRFRLFALSAEPKLERGAARRDFDLATAGLVLEQVELRAILELRRSVFDLLRSLRR